jgi:copper resistance protein C
MIFPPSIKPLAVIAAATGVLFSVVSAKAHAHLISAAPAPNSTVASPTDLVLHFSEALEPKFSGFELTKPDGSKVAVSTSVSSDDHNTLLSKLTSALVPGAYSITWHVVSADGHRMTGAFNFNVR